MCVFDPPGYTIDGKGNKAIDGFTLLYAMYFVLGCFQVNCSVSNAHPPYIPVFHPFLPTGSQVYTNLILMSRISRNFNAQINPMHSSMCTE